MTIPNIKPLGYALRDPLTSADATAITTYLARAVDGNGGTYGGSLHFTGGFSVDNLTSAFADVTAIQIENTALLDGAIMTASGGAHIEWETGTQAVFKNGSIAIFQNNAGINVQSGGAIIVSTGGVFLLDTGTDVTIAAPVKHVENFTRIMQIVDYDDASWGAFGDGGFVQRSLTGTPLYARLNLPDGATLTGVGVYIKGGPGHSSMPANPPKIQVAKTTLASYTVTQIGADQPDTTSTILTYEALHTFTLTGLSEVFGSGKIYYMRIFGEGGAGAVLGAQVIPFAIYTTAKLDWGQV